MIVKPFLSRVSSAAIAIAILTGSAPAFAATAPSVATAQKSAVNGWGVPLTDVTPDSSIKYGTLPNGMKYAIMHNATPKGTASVRLRFEFGSIAETDNERGLAHFIEHMAFNGSTHVPEGDMVKILERQGLEFGPDTNAVTSFDSTTYMLDLPKADAEHIDTAMFLFREVASELKLDPAAVDRERGVILGEKRARDNFQYHQVVDMLGFQIPRTPYPERLPIGVDSVLKSASADTIRSLYQRYYRPENATLVFVGDADPAIVEGKIRKTFADWKDASAAGAPLPRGKVDLARPAAFDTFVDPAVATTVNYTIARPWEDPADTLAERKRKIAEGVATAMFNRRLQKLVNTPGSPLLGGGMGTDEERDAALMTSVVLAAKDGAWKDALTAAEQEVRRALEHGFTASELKTQIADMTGALHAAADQADTRTNKSLANTILGVVGRDRFVTTPKFKAAEFDAVAKTLTPEKVNAAFRELWKGSAPLVHVSAKQDIPTQQLAAAFDASRAVAVAAPQASEAQAFAYDSFGPAGTVASDTRVADLGVRTVRFANNVRLNIKKTDFEAGKVRFIVRLGSGILDLPKSEPGLAPMLTITSATAAVKKHSLDELKDLLAGKVITVGTKVQDDAFVASGATTPQDLALQMKVSAAYLLDPGFRPEAAGQWANAVPVIEKQVEAQPEAVAGVRLPILLASGDQRFGMPKAAVLSKRTFDEAKAALAPVIASAPIEITIVGDVDENAAIAAVASTFGALPARKLDDAVDPAVAKASFRADRSPIVLTHDGPEDKAMVEAVWPTTDDSNFREVVGVGLLKDVLDLMLTDSVREKLGDSYGVSLSSNMSDTFKGFGYLSAAAVVAPDKADEVDKAIAEAAASLRDKPVSADLLARARNPELEKADRLMRDNGYWLGTLQKAQSEPERLDRIRQHKALLQSITPADIQKLAQKYLEPATVQKVRIVSSKLATTASN
ncbi:M16 family metallopeptidase [Sphingomonas segetis]|uniref:M16 family metallopeptidase n=1 Tax=Sphingomonas segetis TaxID=1104779 RepID=UPI0012D2DFC5|nr:insulinase family protein [Sphingomonas segetis]